MMKTPNLEEMMTSKAYDEILKTAQHWTLISTANARKVRILLPMKTAHKQM